MINLISKRKLIICNNENNNKQSLNDITSESYIFVFISLKITFSKSFRNNNLDKIFFIDNLVLLTINQIYLVKK